MRSFDDLDDAVVLDVETTGLSRETDRIVAVSMLRGRFSTLRDNPGDLKGDTPNALFKQFMDSQSFKCWLTDAVFGLAHEQAGVG